MRLLFLSLICLLILLCSCQQKAEKVSTLIVDTTGLNEQGDATRILTNALDSCKHFKFQKLVIPKGEYHFYATKSFQKYVAASNNDNGLKRIAFLLEDFNGLEIDASGSHFIFHGMLMPFEISNCSNITLKGFSIDYSGSFLGQATVLTVNEKESSFDIQMEEGSYEIHADRLYFKTIRGHIDIQKNIWFDPATKATVYNVSKHKIDPWSKWIADSYSANDLGNNKVRIVAKNILMPKPGWIWVAKGGEGCRLIPGIHISNSKNINIDSVQIFHTGGMAIIAEKSEDITVNHLKVVLPENSKRMVSSAADATHFVNCKGTIKISNSVFENMLDDAINVHGIYVKIKNSVASNIVGVVRDHQQQWGFDFAQKGDSVQFIENTSMNVLGSALVKGVKNYNEEYMELVLDRDVSEWSISGNGIENISWAAALEFKNNIVRQNRARSVLVSTSKPVLIEGNLFSSMMAGIVVSGDVNYWFESGSVTNMIIRNNQFINPCTGGNGNVALMIVPIVRDFSKMKGYYHKNIVIEKNLFDTFDKGIIYAHSVENLSIKDNIIKRNNTQPSLHPEKPCFEILMCKNVIFENNLYIHFDSTTKADIKIDSHSLKSFINKNNAFFNDSVDVVDKKGSEFLVL